MFLIFSVLKLVKNKPEHNWTNQDRCKPPVTLPHWLVAHQSRMPPAIPHCVLATVTSLTQREPLEIGDFSIVNIGKQFLNSYFEKKVEYKLHFIDIYLFPNDFLNIGDICIIKWLNMAV